MIIKFLFNNICLLILFSDEISFFYFDNKTNLLVKKRRVADLLEFYRQKFKTRFMIVSGVTSWFLFGIFGTKGK